jgi:hypothetical protein
MTVKVLDIRKSWILVLALLSLLAFTAPAMAWHPHEDDAIRARDGIPRDPDNQLPVCDEMDEGGVYGSLDDEIWVCVNDKPGSWSPEIPPQPYWEPLPPGTSPDDWDGGDVAWAKRWNPVSIPGYPGVYSRTLSRSEWVNPTKTGTCPNVTGGCKFKAGGDIQFVRNGQKFDLNRTWFKRAIQLYVWNKTTAVWEKKADTGWMQQLQGSATYPGEMVGTYDYGTAPYGSTWYFARTQLSVWNGSAWVTQPVLDPVNASGGLDYVYDDKPGEKEPKDKRPPRDKKPKAEKPSKKGVTPPATVPSNDAVDVPSGTP